MEYKLFPKHYAILQKGEALSFKEKKQDEMQKAINNLSANNYNKTKRVHKNKLFNKISDFFEFPCEKTFGAYMSAVIAIMAIIVFLAGLGLGIGILMMETPSGVGWKILALIGGIICGGIAGVIAGAIGGFVYGGILGFLLSPILYPTYLIVCTIKINNSKKKQEKEALRIEKEITNIKAPYLEDIAKNNKKVETNIIDYENNFEKEVLSLSKKFSSNSIINKITEWLINEFMKINMFTSRAEHIQNINFTFDFYIGEKEIRCATSKYDFIENRCSLLDGAVQQAALAKTLITSFDIKIHDIYKLDDSGKEYNIDYLCRYPVFNEHSFNQEQTNLYVTISAKYSALNGNYKSNLI